jgi:hypothetical protein
LQPVGAAAAASAAIHPNSDDEDNQNELKERLFDVSVKCVYYKGQRTILLSLSETTSSARYFSLLTAQLKSVFHYQARLITHLEQDYEVSFPYFYIF